MDRVVFLDRDGTINQEVHYLHKPEDLVLLPGVPEAIRALREAGFRIVVVTNQAGVARGYYTCQEVEHMSCWKKTGRTLITSFTALITRSTGLGSTKSSVTAASREPGCSRWRSSITRLTRRIPI